MLELNAVIEPGKAAAAILLGNHFASIEQSPRDRNELGNDLDLLDFGAIRVWVRNHVIIQIGVRHDYNGTIGCTRIGIGSSLKDINNELGTVTEDYDDTLVVATLPGICFETATWRGDPRERIVANNLDAKIADIFVFLTEFGELPDRRTRE